MIDEIVFHERALVGACLVNPSILDDSELQLAGRDWIDPVCDRLWPILCRLRREGVPLGDTRLVIKAVGRSLDEIGGISELGKLAAKDAAFQGQEGYHRQKLVDAQNMIRLQRIASEILRRSEKPKADPAALVSWASQELNATPISKAITRQAGDVMAEIIGYSKNGSKPLPAVPTGLADFDSLNGGFRPGQLAILAARPSIGKSALASQIGIDAAKADHAVLHVSLEMTATETISRALAMECGISMRAAQNGEMQRHEIDQAENIRQVYADLPLYICDRRGMTVDGLKRLVRSEAAARKLGLVIVDYLGLIQATDRRKPRWEQVSETSSALKTLALAESVPILALSQLNRESEGEAPKLSHLRDSGSLEQDADLVFLLHRESRKATAAKLYVAKNRNGKTGIIELEYAKERFHFRRHVPKSEYGDDFSNFRS